MKKLLAIVLAFVVVLGSSFMMGCLAAVKQTTLDDQELAELNAIENYGEGKYEVELYEPENGDEDYIYYIVLENGVCRGAASMNRNVYMNRYS